VRATASKGLSKAKATFPAAVRKLAGTYHYHVCATASCRSVFYCNCKEPEVDPECKACRWPERNRPLWDEGRDRKACCKDIKNLKQVTDSDVIAGYRLAGPGPWWQCTICYLSHGRNPTA
jgi:hypothetical protein